MTIAASRSVNDSSRLAKNGLAHHAELVVTAEALEPAAACYVVGLDTAAARANGFAVCLPPTQETERLVSCIFARVEHGFEAESASLGGEEKCCMALFPVLVHMIASCTLWSMAFASHVVAFATDGLADG
jgi:hypothetical protein